MKVSWGLVVLVFFSFGVFSYLSRALAGCLVCWILAGCVIIVALIFTPKKVLLHEDKVVIKLWLGHTVTIPADNIKAVEKSPKPFVFLSQDIPFRSSWSTPVRIVRKKGFAFVVTPLNPDKFVAGFAEMMSGSSPDLLGRSAQMK